MLLAPRKGTQGREMNRKIWIASTLALVCAICALPIAPPAVALASSPLLSGYGGPGAGEQALIGSTLLGGSHGGSGSAGSPRSAAGSSGSGGSGGAPATANLLSRSGASASAGGAAGGGSGSSSGHVRGRATAGSQTARNDGSSASPADAEAFVYPSSPSSAPASSSALDLSSGDVLALVGIAASLALLGALTVRLSRLQR